MPSKELSPSELVRPALNAMSPRLLIEAHVKAFGSKPSRALSATLVKVYFAAAGEIAGTRADTARAAVRMRPSRMRRWTSVGAERDIVPPRASWTDQNTEPAHGR